MLRHGAQRTELTDSCNAALPVIPAASAISTLSPRHTETPSEAPPLVRDLHQHTTSVLACSALLQAADPAARSPHHPSGALASTAAVAASPAAGQPPPAATTQPSNTAHAASSTQLAARLGQLQGLLPLPAALHSSFTTPAMRASATHAKAPPPPQAHHSTAGPHHSIRPSSHTAAS